VQDWSIFSSKKSGLLENHVATAAKVVSLQKEEIKAQKLHQHLMTTVLSM